MRIFGSSPTRKISRGRFLGAAIFAVSLAAAWGWTAFESQGKAPEAGSVHLSLSFKRTRMLAYQRWMGAHRELAADPNGMSPVEGKVTLGGKTFTSRVSAHGENSFTVDLAHGESWNGARRLRLVRKDAALEEGTSVSLEVNGHPEGSYVLTEAPTLEKMLRQGKRLGVLFNLDSSGRLALAAEPGDKGNPVFAERRNEALARVAANDARLFADPSLARAREASPKLVVFYDPDTGRLLPVAPGEALQR